MSTFLKEPIIGWITQCQICGNQTLEPILELGHQPPVHGHLTPERLHQPETTYPLTMCRCPQCELVQLDYAVDPTILFGEEYPYHTGMTQMLVRNCRALADLLITKHNLTAQDLVMDIGSNDGTLLQGFHERGIRVLGIEPTGVAKTANERGIPTLQKFFTEAVAHEVYAAHGHAKVIAATNVFAHINNLYEFLRGIETLLAPDGVFVSESQYLLDIIEKLEFDTIYHEHLRFYSLKPLVAMFEKTGMSLVDAERISAAGGSIRIYAAKGKQPPSQRLQELLAAEEHAGLSNVSTLHAFARRARDAKQKLLALVATCRQEGGRVVGLGAPARSNTLLGFTGIDRDMLEYAAERKGSPKIGLYTPGTHIPIVDEEHILNEQPEYTLLLSWHIGQELMEKMRERGYRGKFIMPLPEPTIVG